MPSILLRSLQCDSSLLPAASILKRFSSSPHRQPFIVNLLSSSHLLPVHPRLSGANGSMRCKSDRDSCKPGLLCVAFLNGEGWRRGYLPKGGERDGTAHTRAHTPLPTRTGFRVKPQWWTVDLRCGEEDPGSRKWGMQAGGLVV